MSTLDYAADDFRADAVMRSAEALGRARLPADAVDLWAAGVSLCVPASSDILARRRAMKGLLLVQLTITFGLIAAGVALIYWAWTVGGPIPPRARFTCGTGGVIVVGLGWIMMCAAADCEGAIARLLLRRYASPVPSFTATENPRLVRIEDPRTYRSTKLVVEDLGLFYCDSRRQLIVIEGLFYRYVIRAEDIRALDLQQTHSTRFVMLTLAIAASDLTLTLALSTNGAVQAISRYFDSSSPSPLAAVIGRTLRSKPMVSQDSVLPLPEL